MKPTSCSTLWPSHAGLYMFFHVPPEFFNLAAPPHENERSARIMKFGRGAESTVTFPPSPPFSPSPSTADNGMGWRPPATRNLPTTSTPPFYFSPPSFNTWRKLHNNVSGRFRAQGPPFILLLVSLTVRPSASPSLSPSLSTPSALPSGAVPKHPQPPPPLSSCSLPISPGARVLFADDAASC